MKKRLVQKKQTTVAVFVGALALVATTACHPGKSGKPDNLCQVVTKADVVSAFGGTVGEGVSTEDHCRYAISGKLTSGQTVNAAMGGYVEVAWNEHVMAKNSSVAKLTMEPVTGFENAWWEGVANTLFVEARGGELSYQAELPLTGQMAPLAQMAKKGEVDPKGIPLLTEQGFTKQGVVALATATYARGVTP
jgi:hypothetical protein